MLIIYTHQVREVSGGIPRVTPVQDEGLGHVERGKVAPVHNVDLVFRVVCGEQIGTLVQNESPSVMLGSGGPVEP